MLDQLSDRLGAIFSRLSGRGKLSESDVNDAMREVRVALLEADVSLAAAKQFVARVKEQAVGQNVLESLTPAQTIVKIVHDELVALLGRRGSAPGVQRLAAVGHHAGRSARLGQDDAGR